MRTHPCPYCDGIGFGQKSTLNTLIDTVHLKLREHACSYCPGVAYQTKSHLTRHIDTVHLKLRDHGCPYCPGVAFGEGHPQPRPKDLAPSHHKVDYNT